MRLSLKRVLELYTYKYSIVKPIFIGCCQNGLHITEDEEEEETIQEKTREPLKGQY